MTVNVFPAWAKIDPFLRHNMQRAGPAKRHFHLYMGVHQDVKDKRMDAILDQMAAIPGIKQNSIEVCENRLTLYATTEAVVRISSLDAIRAIEEIRPAQLF